MYVYKFLVKDLENIVLITFIILNNVLETLKMTLFANVKHNT